MSNLYGKLIERYTERDLFTQVVRRGRVYLKDGLYTRVVTQAGKQTVTQWRKRP